MAVENERYFHDEQIDPHDLCVDKHSEKNAKRKKF